MQSQNGTRNITPSVLLHVLKWNRLKQRTCCDEIVYANKKRSFSRNYIVNNIKIQFQLLYERKSRGIAPEIVERNCEILFAAILELHLIGIDWTRNSVADAQFGVYASAVNTAKSSVVFAQYTTVSTLQSSYVRCLLFFFNTTEIEWKACDKKN